MKIIGLTVSAPDVPATEEAWRRLGPAGVTVDVVAGEPALAAVTLGVADVAATEWIPRSSSGWCTTTRSAPQSRAWSTTAAC